MTSKADITDRQGEAGFSLVEVIVALAVFSVAVIALLAASGENARALTAVTERTLADMVAENRLVEAMVGEPVPPVGITGGEDRMGGEVWVWRQSVAETGNSGLRRIEITVRSADGEQAISTRTAFRGTR